MVVREVTVVTVTRKSNCTDSTNSRKVDVNLATLALSTGTVSRLADLAVSKHFKPIFRFTMYVGR